MSAPLKTLAGQEIILECSASLGKEGYSDKQIGSVKLHVMLKVISINKNIAIYVKNKTNKKITNKQPNKRD